MGPNQRFMQHGQFASTPSPHGMANNYNGTHPIVYRGGGMSKSLLSYQVPSQASLTMPDVQFKPSPFYTIQQQLAETKLCESKPHCLMCNIL
jgi:hypothetical protein